MRPVSIWGSPYTKHHNQCRRRLRTCFGSELLSISQLVIMQSKSRTCYKWRRGSLNSSTSSTSSVSHPKSYTIGPGNVTIDFDEVEEEEEGNDNDNDNGDYDDVTYRIINRAKMTDKQKQDAWELVTAGTTMASGSCFFWYRNPTTLALERVFWATPVMRQWCEENKVFVLDTSHKLNK